MFKSYKKHLPVFLVPAGHVGQTLLQIRSELVNVESRDAA